MSSRPLLLAAVALASACTPHAVRSSSVSLCRSAGCETVADTAARQRLLTGFHDLLKKFKGGRIALYASEPRKANETPGLHFYTQGGPIPGVSTLSALEIRDVLFIDKERGESTARAHIDAYYVGLPLLCSEGDLGFTLPDGEPTLYFSDVCNWMAVGTTGVRFEWKLDRLELEHGILSGHWAVKTVGFPVIGGGHGYAVGRFEEAPAAPAAPAVAAAPPPPPPPAPKPAPKPLPAKPAPPPEPVVETISEAVDLSLEVALKDQNGDRILDGGETIELDARVKNLGKSKADKLVVRLSGDDTLLKCLGSSKELPALAAGGSESAVFSCRLPRAVPTRTVELRVDALAGGNGAGAHILRVGMKGAAETVEQVVSDVSVDEIPPTSKAAQGSANVALVIGLSRYREKAVPRVKYASRDADVMARYLQRVAGVKPENLKLLTDDSATKSDLEAYLGDWLPRRVGPESTVYVFYAGHGAHDDQGKESFLVPYEGHPDFPSKLYPLSAMYAALSKLKAKSVVVMLDSCFSGAGDRGLSKAGARPLVSKTDEAPPPDPRIDVLAGAAGTQEASDLDSAEHGLFTYYLLKGLRGEADADGDGTVTVGELYSFARAGVAAKASRELNRDQTPVLLGAPQTNAVPVSRR